MTKVFIPLVGQFTNVGDTLHRSVLIEWLKDDCELHLYIGQADESFISGLHVSGKFIFYRSLIFWYLKALFFSKKSVFFYNPGEITGSLKRFFKEIFLFPLLSTYKFNSRPALKVGVDIQYRSKFNDFLYSLTNYFTTYSFYRTESSFLRFGNGEVIPDLGFYRFDPTQLGDRNYICLSFRGDRNLFNDETLIALKDFSKEKKLKICVVVQVRMDNLSAMNLRDKFSDHGMKIETILWHDNVSHSDQEKEVNRLYKKAKLTISDRLHVLIAAANNGSIPICIAPYYSSKIENHFNVINFSRNVFKQKESIAETKALLELSLKRDNEISKRMIVAKNVLEERKMHIINMLNKV